MAHVEDLWVAPDGSKRPRHGTGRRYRVRWVDPDEAERSRSFDRKGDAKAFLTGIGADLQRGVYRDPAAGQVTLRKVAEDWLASRTFSQSSWEATERRIRLHILPVLGSRPVARITPSAVQAWLAGLGVAPRTARLLRTVLASILQAAVDDGLIGTNPARSGSVQAPPMDKRLLVPWTAPQVATIRDTMPGRYAAMIDCGAHLGLRIGEALALSASDIDWLRRTVHVRRQLKRVGGKLVYALPKGRKERTVPLPDSAALALSAHIAAHPPAPVELPWHAPGGKLTTVSLLFTSSTGRPVDRMTWTRNAWHPAVKAAGISPGRDAGFHQLRHRYASALLAAGVDIRTVSSALGHGDPGFTLRTYAHLMPDADDRIRAAIDREAQTPDGTATAQQAGNP